MGVVWTFFLSLITSKKKSHTKEFSLTEMQRRAILRSAIYVHVLKVGSWSFEGIIILLIYL